MMKKTLWLTATTIALALGGFGCDDDDPATTDTTDDNMEGDAFTPSQDMGPTNGDSGGEETRTLTLTFEGLPELGEGYEYEGWLIVAETPVSTGRFDVVDGTIEPATFQVDAADADAAGMFVLTIEPSVGDDPAPADTHVVAGAFAAGSADLGIEHPAALGDDFASAAGTFFLATPTSAATDDDAQGIWFIDASGGAPAAGLALPELPAGWVYEGWVVDIAGDAPMPISTGTFTAVDAADSDDAGDAAGPEAAPPFPGQDFIDPVRDLSDGHMAVISIEPSPDDSPAPFQLKPLATPIEAGTGMENPQTLGLAIEDNTITGTATLE